MVRVQTVVAGAIALMAGVFMLPACSSSNGDTPAGPSCTNGTKDDGEEGVDCGGVCPTKCTGSGCTVGTECASGMCNAKMCAAPAGKPCGVGATPPTCADGQACELDKDCQSGFCDGKTCATPAAGSHSDGMKNAGETGIDCGGSVKATKPCPDGQGCIDSTDCTGTCTNMVCGPIGPMDGKKDNGETDVDCGGAKAPKCADGKSCVADTDCVTGYCPTATHKCIAPSYSDGVKNGNETDVDCGGTGPGMKKCAETKTCLVDADCNGACKTRGMVKTCIDAPSCKPLLGGDTCGIGEVDLAGKVHESCCRTLEVKGYTDPRVPTKKVYLDKYEITAGRMRAFIDAMSAAHAGVPNVQAYITANTPARWNAGWSKVLPQSFASMPQTYNVGVDPSSLYPTDADYRANSLYGYVFNSPGSMWGVNPGPQTIYVGVYSAFGYDHFYPEWYAQTPAWPYADYSASHELNCSNTTPDGLPDTANGSAGFGTYWFDAATLKANGPAGTVGKVFTQDQLDQKALNCTPFGLFAAFCAWDGGQLATTEVIDQVTNGGVACPVGVPNLPDSPANGWCVATKLADGKIDCGPGGNTLNTRGGSDAECPNLVSPGVDYVDPVTGLPNGTGPAYYPDAKSAESYDKSFKISAPGRVLADEVKLNDADPEGWKDLKGNLVEAALAPGGTFEYRGYGIGWGSLRYHTVQATTPRHKSASFGARCMRFK